jgi:hypothetical protein
MKLSLERLAKRFRSIFTIGGLASRPEDGLIYRMTGVEGVIDKAQADSDVHSGPLAGVGSGGVLLSHKHCLLYMKMDVQPVVGAPVYVSPTVEGKGSHTAALNLLPAWSVLRDRTVGSDYAADVVPYAPILGSADFKGLRDAEVVRHMLAAGVPYPQNGSSWFEDFDIELPVGSSAPYKWMANASGLTPGVSSVIVETGGGFSTNATQAGLVPAAGFAAIPMSFSGRMKASGGTSGARNACIGLVANCSTVGYTYSFGIFPGSSSTRWQFACDLGFPQTNNPPPNLIDVGPVVAGEWVQFEIEFDGAGRRRFGFNGVFTPWTSQEARANSWVQIQAWSIGSGAWAEYDWLHLWRGRRT